jgi:hypothetical protein
MYIVIIRIFKQLLFVFKLFFRIILRVMLLMFTLLGLGSSYGLEKSCGHLTGGAYGNCWEDWQMSSGGAAAITILLLIFIIIAIPATSYLYRLIKSDITDWRNRKILIRNRR